MERGRLAEYSDTTGWTDGPTPRPLVARRRARRVGADAVGVRDCPARDRASAGHVLALRLAPIVRVQCGGEATDGPEVADNDRTVAERAAVASAVASVPRARWCAWGRTSTTCASATGRDAFSLTAGGRTHNSGNSHLLCLMQRIRRRKLTASRDREHGGVRCVDQGSGIVSRAILPGLQIVLELVIDSSYGGDGRSRRAIRFSAGRSQLVFRTFRDHELRSLPQPPVFPVSRVAVRADLVVQR
jgi:hypothetical protein